MWIRHTYYFLKPILPWSLRIGLRRWRAAKRRIRFSSTWPINESTGQPPEGWQGWPEGRKFALVLTHDVEGTKGLGRCRELMESEADLGFRSSFNFVPEGEYAVSQELRDQLVARRFEVGVHDLRHDGKLYLSRSVFKAHAQRINHYLKEWNAVGFRSGFMHHNLEWLHDLKVQYDSSTFDTDPFEPQPDAADTIFPFWVPGTNGGGYLELPYTLVQDFTLFVMLKEPNVEVWKKKLDWIASRGGMALLNVHPDYIHFGSGKCPRGEYPIAHYREFLQYAATRYSGEYWNALPREVAAQCADSRPRKARTRSNRICMVAYSHYEFDNRINRYATALKERGDEVDVIALDNGLGHPREENLDGVNLFRIQRRTGEKETKWSYLADVVRFVVRSSLFLARRHARHPYTVIHVHNMPDFLVFATWYPKFKGARVILDIHDVQPDLYVSKFKSSEDKLGYKCLLLIERLSARWSDHVIISNHLWYDKMVSRSTSTDKCSVFINHVDEKLFYLRPRKRNDGTIRMIFPGSFQWHQGLDIAIRAFALAHREIPQMEFHLHGGGDQKSTLLDLISELGMEKNVLFKESAPLSKMPELLAEADLGIVPKRADSFGNEAYSTKIMEFMSQGVPAIISRTKIDSYYFDDSVVEFFESGNHQELARAMLKLVRSKELRAQLSRNGCEYVTRNSWGNRKQAYLDLVDSLSPGN